MRLFTTETFETAIEKIMERSYVALMGNDNEYALFGRTESGRILYLPIRIDAEARASDFIGHQSCLDPYKEDYEHTLLQREELKGFLLQRGKIYSTRIEKPGFLFLFGAEESVILASKIGVEIPVDSAGCFWQMDMMRPLTWHIWDILNIPPQWVEDSLTVGSNPLPHLREMFPNLRFTTNTKIGGTISRTCGRGKTLYIS